MCPRVTPGTSFCCVGYLLVIYSFFERTAIMIYSMDIKVGYSQVNSSLELTNDSILEMFEDIACFHGNLAGENVLFSKTAWILTGYMVKVIKRPKYSDDIKLNTWARVIHGIMSVREFEILDDKGERCIVAS